MGYIKQIEQILESQKGTLLSLNLDENNIPRVYLSKMLKAKAIERIARGVYVAPNLLEDEMLILQKKYPNIIYSHETALFFHNLSDRTPFEFSLTVPSGYNAVKTLIEKSKIYYIKKEYHSLGVVEGETPLGNKILLYNLERTICDIVRSRNRIDIQIFSHAIKKATSKKMFDSTVLLDYAKKFSIDKILINYMEVLL